MTDLDPFQADHQDSAPEVHPTASDGSPPSTVAEPRGAEPDPDVVNAAAIEAWQADERERIEIEISRYRPTKSPQPAWQYIPDDAEEVTQRDIRTQSAIKRAAFSNDGLDMPEWPDPVNFWGAQRLPRFKDHWVFPAIRPFILNQAAMVGCDPGITYIQAITFAAGCLSDDIKVRVRPSQDWAEAARIWACVVGESGDGKSPSLRAVTQQARDLTMRVAERSREKQASFDDEFKIWEMDVAAWRNKKQKGEPAGDRPPEPRRPVNELLYFNGTTAEGLLNQQEQSTRGTMLIADEMLSWLNSMDQYKASGKGSDRQLWLSSWDGAEYVGILVGKLRTIPNTGVTIIGGSQPSAMRGAADKLNLDQDGLLQRVLIYNSLGDADESDEHVADREAMARFRAILGRLYAMKTHLDHCVFSPQAHVIRREADAWIASLRGVHGIPVAARQALSKWRAYLPRIALTLHAIEAADKGCDVIPATIEDTTIDCAWAYMRECLWPHMLAFYDSLIDRGEETASVKAFANYVMARGIERIKPHQLASKWTQYRRFSTIQQRREFWARVEQAAWARPCGVIDKQTGIAREYEINPLAFDGRFAEQISAAQDQVERYRQAMHPAFLAAQGRQPGED